MARFTWSYKDFTRFYELLTLPEGRPARLEGFQRLILRTVFTSGMVELLVLIPKGHAKTTLMAALAVYHTLITPNANCYIGAADKIQADEMYRFACHFVSSEPEIAARLKVLKGTREIRSQHDQGFIRVLASDDSKQGGKKQGFNPTLALIDELHAHENDNLYIDMRSGLFKRKGMLVTISTAGWDLEGVLGSLRRTFLDCRDKERRLNATTDGGTVEDPDGRLTVARKPSGKSVMLEWACAPDRDDLDDMAVVKLANPASWVTIESLEDAKESLTPWTFRRYRCNLWTLTFESWLPEGSWEALTEPGLVIDPDLPVVAALDMARYRDCAAIAVVQMRPGKRAACSAWIRPGSESNPVPYGEVEDAIEQLAESFTLTACGYDPKYADQIAVNMMDKGVEMEEFPQSNERMGPAASGLRQAIVADKALAHDGDPEFAAHVMAAMAKEIGDNMFKLVKSKQNGPPIDGGVALAMAWALAMAENAEPSAEMW
jgi:phage terminase large subunit-like protein